MASSIVERVLRRFLSAGDVIPFGGKKPVNTHFVKIHNEKYVLSNDGGPLGDPDEQDSGYAGEMGARLIVGPGAGKFKYLWVYDTDRQIVAMWRAHDGNEKVHQRASSMQAKLIKLDKKNQINRVSHETYVVIARAMQQAARDNEASLKQWIAEMETDFQKTVNELTKRYFDEHVRQDIERAVAAVQSGVVPLGYKAFGAPQDRERHMTTKVISDVLSRRFTEPLVERFVSEQGVDLESGDNQAVQWAVGDVTQAVFEEYLPERADHHSDR
jgi:hypothetical protein